MRKSGAGAMAGLGSEWLKVAHVAGKGWGESKLAEGQGSGVFLSVPCHCSPCCSGSGMNLKTISPLPPIIIFINGKLYICCKCPCIYSNYCRGHLKFELILNLGRYDILIAIYRVGGLTVGTNFFKPTSRLTRWGKGINLGPKETICLLF